MSGPRLAGKVCLITGAGSGIGRSSALLFAREGASVAVADLDAGAAEATVSEIASAGGEAAAFTVDVTREADCDALAAAVAGRYGRIDVLFNNAGIAGVGTVHETSLDLWEAVMAVNVRGVFLVSKFVVPLMIAQGSGSIINMSSCIAEIGLADRASYAASKGAVLALSRQVGATIFPIGLGTNVDRPVLEQLATASGGEVSFVSDASLLGDQFHRIIENLRRRYVVSYTSTNSVRDGAWRTFESLGTNCLANPHIRGIVWNSRDVTDRKVIQQRIQHLAYHDNLTGLPNRGLLQDRLARSIARCTNRKAASRRYAAVARTSPMGDRFQPLDAS